MTFKKLTKTIPLKMCFMLTIINLKYGLATQQGHNFSSFYEKAFLKIHFLHKFFFGGRGWVIALVVRIRVGQILKNDLGYQLGQRKGIENQLVEIF